MFTQTPKGNTAPVIVKRDYCVSHNFHLRNITFSISIVRILTPQKNYLIV